ncbi:MAG: hypothetical protein ABIQ35_01430, partial [Verrucomicrobiota bacterium]
MREKSSASVPAKASIFYRSVFWRIGLALARNLPPRVSQALCSTIAGIYWRLNPRRLEMVSRNLAGALNGDHAKAIVASKCLFRQFAIKLSDLWRYESGIPIDDLFSELTGWDHFLAA